MIVFEFDILENLQRRQQKASSLTLLKRLELLARKKQAELKIENLYHE